MSDSAAQSSVMKTLAYFDALDIPLTPAELWMNLFKSEKQYSFNDVVDQLSHYIEKKLVSYVRGFAVLHGRDALVDERIRREVIAISRYRTLIRIIKVLRFVPFIRMVAVCNTLAFDVARKEGDSDLFIVTKRNRLYLCRLFVTALLHVLGVRRHGLKVEKRICLSFYVDEDGINMSRFAIPGGDPYLVQWTRRVVPVFSVLDTYERFWKTNSVWLKSQLQDPMPYRPIPMRSVSDTWISRNKRGALEFLLWPIAALLEKLARRFEHRHMRNAPDHHIRLTTTGVVIDNHTLKFHEEDRRQFFRDRMSQTIASMANSAHV